jgi:hypothetical protein
VILAVRTLADQGDRNVVFAVNLDCIHGFVSHANDYIQRIRRIKKSRGTYAKGDLPAMSFHRFQESQAKFAEHEFCGGRVSLGQEKREFDSAETPEVIADTHITSQARGYLNQ